MLSDLILQVGRGMLDETEVLSGAHVVEQGTHDKLIASGGPYSELYTIQASAYRLGVDVPD